MKGILDERFRKVAVLPYFINWWCS